MKMNTAEYFLKMFNYDHWANRECLNALRAITPQPPKVLRLLAHILSAQKLWLERLQRVPQSVAVWPSSTIEDCADLADEMLSAWNNYLTELPPADLEQEISYRNSKGESWSSRVEDIITHVLLHSAYHRGQVALEMRAVGLQPAYTDFIHGVRQGLVK
jgi:uncharacterized damage-inducible protein DinB